MSDFNAFCDFINNMGAMVNLYREFSRRHHCNSWRGGNPQPRLRSHHPQQHMVTIYSKNREDVILSQEDIDHFHSELGISGAEDLNISWANFVHDGRYVVACLDAYSEDWLVRNTHKFTEGALGAIPSNKTHFINTLWKVLVPPFLIINDPEMLLYNIFEYNSFTHLNAELVNYVYPRVSGKRELELLVYLEDDKEQELMDFYGLNRFDDHFEMKYGMYWLHFRREEDDDSSIFSAPSSPGGPIRRLPPVPQGR